MSIDDVEHGIRSFQSMRNQDGPAADAAWPVFLESLDAYLSQPPERLSLSPLIRARVAAEFELDQERRRPEGADPELERLVSALVSRIDLKVRAVHTMAKASDRTRDQEGGPLAWPLSRGVITSGYGYRRDPLTRTVRFHAGLDLASEENEPVLAAAPGRVTHAGWAGDAGRAVKLQHDGKIFTVYAHLSCILVSPDQSVRTGDVLGFVGASGRATGPHLHFALVLDDQPADPVEFLRSVPMAFSDTGPGVVFGYGD
jgi:murein DD-endopeptidase MepM/ murein hydrolase activator NlpD